MTYQESRAVLLISKNIDTKSFFKNIFIKFKDSNLVICPKTSKIPSINCFKVIFFEIANISKEQVCTNLKEIDNKCIYAQTFLIVDEKNYNQLDILFNYNCLLLQKPLKKLTIESIVFKYTNSLKDKGFEFVKYQGIILNEKYQYAIFNDCKIFLSENETFIISLLMNDGMVMSCSDIKKAYEILHKQECSQEAIRVHISRIRKKFQRSTGLSVIKNKRSVGYYISI